MDVWKVMHIRTGKIDAIGRADAPQPVGRLLRVEDKNYEVVFNEVVPIEDEFLGWIYVTSVLVPATG